jgi:hypothetical protein
MLILSRNSYVRGENIEKKKEEEEKMYEVENLYFSCDAS